MTPIGTAGLWAMVLACGVMAGVYFTFSAFVMSSLEGLPSAHGIAAMQSINRVIQSSLFMPLFAATSLASLALTVWGFARWGEPGALYLVIGGLVYFGGMFLCTAAFNVPLNNALDGIDPMAPDAAAVWSDYLRTWTRWNHLRTVSSAAACVFFLATAWAPSRDAVVQPSTRVDAGIAVMNALPSNRQSRQERGTR